MKKKSWLTVAVIVVSLFLTACGEEKVVETVVVKETVVQTAVQTLVVEATRELGRTTGPPTKSPPQEHMTPPDDKPPLPLLKGADRVDRHVIGFVFPDGFIALKAAALKSPRQISNQLFEVGIVEKGEKVDTSDEEFVTNLYTVAIDLLTDEPEVGGQMVSLDAGDVIDLDFIRSPQSENEVRWQQFPRPLPTSPIQVGITSDSVCFVVRPDDEDSYWRYCAVPGSALSVQVNFEAHYSDLRTRIEESVEELGYSSNDVALDMAISEMEDPVSIGFCAGDRVPAGKKSEKCGADIAGAPISTFWQDFYIAKDQSQGNPYHVAAAVVRVFKTINIRGKGEVQPGHYVVDYWFDADEVFIGATVSGVTELDEQRQVIGQQIPAIPALFINEDNPEEITSQISAWKLFGVCCFWQSNCP